MKRILVLFIMAFIFNTVLVQAETTVTPSDFITSHDLMILDENSLNSISDGGFIKGTMNEYSFASVVLGETNGIVWNDDTFYIAMDFTAIFGNGVIDAHTFKQIYIDFCKLFSHYDVYTCTSNNSERGIIYSENPDALSFIESNDDSTQYVYCKTMAEYLMNVEEFPIPNP